MTHIAFPLTFDSGGRSAATGTEAYVRMLIGQLLLTSPGERVMRPEFGSGLRQILFGGSDPSIAIAVELGLQGALNQWLGDLVEVGQVQVTSDEATLRVSVAYTLRGTGEGKIATIERPVA
ncbi:hypothetical protein SAMN05518801_101346 [Novosphingobium sp. CF614]|uniref:GPW/gp25 family protein n=1 Tax=Novosphingobium sp. CF614 TaxID=1884364 RepID=UPI0008ECA7D9|nr:GPW/gp25 family protein [Novosphingobium sp. CF614]SFF76471.1 hypothetical protein SAMN05518801_101346 [Novosphingobium sp. CF614]